MGASAAALAASACAAGFVVAALAVLGARLRHPYLRVGMRIIASWAAGAQSWCWRSISRDLALIAACRDQSRFRTLRHSP